ncbi:MAG: hypothetical protein WDW38_003818 [Sanguina aurantia]
MANMMAAQKGASCTAAQQRSISSRTTPSIVCSLRVARPFVALNVKGAAPSRASSAQPLVVLRSAEVMEAPMTEDDETDFIFNLTDARKNNTFEESDVIAAMSYFQEGLGSAPIYEEDHVSNFFGSEDASYFDDIDNNEAYEADEFCVAGIPEAAPKQRGRGGRRQEAGKAGGDDEEDDFSKAREQGVVKAMEDRMVMAAQMEEMGLDKKPVAGLSTKAAGPAVWDWMQDFEDTDSVSNNDRLSGLVANPYRAVSSVADNLPSDEVGVCRAHGCLPRRYVEGSSDQGRAPLMGRGRVASGRGSPMHPGFCALARREAWAREGCARYHLNSHSGGHSHPLNQSEHAVAAVLAQLSTDSLAPACQAKPAPRAPQQLACAPQSRPGRVSQCATPPCCNQPWTLTLLHLSGYSSGSALPTLRALRHARLPRPLATIRRTPGDAQVLVSHGGGCSTVSALNARGCDVLARVGATGPHPTGPDIAAVATGDDGRVTACVPVLSTSGSAQRSHDPNTPNLPNAQMLSSDLAAPPPSAAPLSVPWKPQNPDPDALFPQMLFSNVRASTLGALDINARDLLEFLVDDFDLDNDLKMVMDVDADMVSNTEELPELATVEQEMIDEVDALLKADLSLPELDADFMNERVGGFKAPPGMPRVGSVVLVAVVKGSCCWDNWVMSGASGYSQGCVWMRTFKDGTRWQRATTGAPAGGLVAGKCRVGAWTCTATLGLQQHPSRDNPGQALPRHPPCLHNGLEPDRERPASIVVVEEEDEDAESLDPAQVQAYLDQVAAVQGAELTQEQTEMLFAPDAVQPSAVDAAECAEDADAAADAALLSGATTTASAEERMSEEEAAMAGMVDEDDEDDEEDADLASFRSELEALEEAASADLEYPSEEAMDVVGKYLELGQAYLTGEEDRKAMVAEAVAAGTMDESALELAGEEDMVDVESELLDLGDDNDDALDEPPAEEEDDGIQWTERIIQLTRVTKVVKGGKLMGFRCTAVVGNQAGLVGVGCAAGREVATAVKRALVDAKKSVVIVSLVGNGTLPHRMEAKFHSARMVVLPASEGTGCIAGGAIRSVLELAGVKDCLAKRIGCRSPLNNARCTIKALTQMRSLYEVSARRGVPMSQLLLPKKIKA